MQFYLFRESIAQSLRRGAHRAICPVILLSLMVASALAQDTTSTTQDSVVAQEEKAQLSADAPAKSILRGRVVYDDTNRPVRRARVILLKTDGTGGMDKTGATNERGEFQVKDLSAGDYFVMVDAPGIITPLGSIDLSEGVNEKTALLAVEKEFDKISVNGTNSVNVQIRARRGGVISGKVTYADGDPAINAQIIILRKKEGRLARFMTGFSPSSILGLRTDDRGIYRIAGLPPGEYVVGATEANTREDARDEYAGLDFFGNSSLSVSYYQNETSRRMATLVKVEAGHDANDINITLIERASYTVSGTVITRQGRAGVRARLTIQNKNEGGPIPFMDSGPSAESDEQGSWTFTNIPDGTYMVTADPASGNTQEEIEDSAKPETPATSNRATSGRPALVLRRVEVTVSGGDLSGITIEVSEGGRVQGTLAAEGGDKKVLQGAAVALSSRDGDAGAERYGYVQADGSFMIDKVSPGEFYLSVPQLGDKFYVKSITAGSTDLMRDGLKIGSGASIDNVRIIISADVARLQGRIVSADDKKPLARASVVVVPSDPARWRLPGSYLPAVTDADGAFQITCAPGTYLVIPLGAGEDVRAIGEAFLKARAAGAKTVTLQPNGRETIELVAGPSTP